MRLTVLLAKYSLAGLANSLVGYAVIFTCMALGFEPMASNVLGYGLGFIASFLQSRHWVFRSSGSVVAEGLRFIPAFLLAFAANLLVLRALLEAGVNPYLAQVGACCIFTAVGFVLNYLFVFRKPRE